MPHKERDQKKKDSKNNVFFRGGFSTIALIVTLLISLTIYASLIFDTRQRRYTFIAAAVPNLLIIGAILVQALIYRRQWDAMQEALKIERDKTSPRLRIANVKVENFEVGKRPVFIIRIANGGLIDARDVELKIGVQFGGEKEQFKWTREQIVTIPANAQENYFVVWNNLLERQDIKSVNSGTRLDVVGHFIYEDIKPKSFCYRYYPWEGERPEGIAQFLPCDFDPGLTRAFTVPEGAPGHDAVTVQKSQPTNAEAQKGREKPR